MLLLSCKDSKEQNINKSMRFAQNDDHGIATGNLGHTWSGGCLCSHWSWVSHRTNQAHFGECSAQADALPRREASLDRDRRGRRVRHLHGRNVAGAGPEGQELHRTDWTGSSFTFGLYHLHIWIHGKTQGRDTFTPFYTFLYRELSWKMLKKCWKMAISEFERLNVELQRIPSTGSIRLRGWPLIIEQQPTWSENS